jgi:hypothetical protein
MGLFFFGKEAYSSNIKEESIALNNSKETQSSVISIHALSLELKSEIIKAGIWKEDCPVSLDRLRLVRFHYYDFNEVRKEDGEIIVLDAVASNVGEIFQEMYEKRIPIAKARSLHREPYRGKDEVSLADNNTACFNWREITGGGAPSLHGLGLAIDYNPWQNPYIKPTIQNEGDLEKGTAIILPAKGCLFLNRNNKRPGMAEEVIDIFRKKGFSVWGGNWNDPIDYQHFQPSRALAQHLISMAADHATTLFEYYAEEPRMFNVLEPSDVRFLSLYRQDPSIFMRVLKEKKGILSATPNEAYKIMLENR